MPKAAACFPAVLRESVIGVAFPQPVVQFPLGETHQTVTELALVIGQGKVHPLHLPMGPTVRGWASLHLAQDRLSTALERG
jgi:hypothetical protein